MNHSTSALPERARLSAATLAAFAAPQLGLAVLYFPVFVYLQPFYAAERGLSVEALGAVLVAVRLLDAVSDPLMGAVSDATRTRLGRRKPWLLASTPLVMLAVWMAMVPPADAGIGHFALWLSALTLAWTMALTPYFAWGGEIVSDYSGRARVTAWRESVFLIGTFLAVALYGSAGEDMGEGLRRIALAVLVLLPLGVGLAVLFAPEPQLRPRRAEARPPLAARIAETWAALRANRPFRVFLASHVVNSAANGLPPVLLVFYVGAVLGGGQQDTALVLGAYFAAAILAAPLWSFAAQRMPKHRAWSFAMLYAMAVFAVVPLLGPGDVTAFIVVSALTGFAYGADLVLPPAIQADIVDVDTAETGQERTGVYFALWSVALKGATGLAGGFALLALGAAGFSAAPGAVNDPAALAALTGLYALAPIALKAIAVAMIWRFPIDAAAQADLRRRIDARAVSEAR